MHAAAEAEQGAVIAVGAIAGRFRRPEGTEPATDQSKPTPLHQAAEEESHSGSASGT
jgi:hypothetical protein